MLAPAPVRKPPAFLRRVDDRESFERFLAIRNDILPHEPLTVEEMESYDRERPPECWVARFLAGDEAFGVIGKPRRNVSTLFVQAAGRDPDCLETDGIYDFLLEEAVRLGASDAVSVQLSRRPQDRLRLERRGFTIQQTNPVSLLDVPDFDPDAFTVNVAAEIVPFAILPTIFGPEWKRLLWHLDQDLRRDVPNAVPFEETPFESFEARTNDPLYRADTRFAAIVEGKLVGMSKWNRCIAEPSTAMTHLTGVRPEFRRRGIARALKVAAITEAKRQGIRHLYADNEINNPMYQLNLQLGFRRVFDILVLGRRLP